MSTLHDVYQNRRNNELYHLLGRVIIKKVGKPMQDAVMYCKVGNQDVVYVQELTEFEKLYMKVNAMGTPGRQRR